VSPDGGAYGFNGADGAASEEAVKTVPDGGVAVPIAGDAAPAVGGDSATDSEGSLTAIAETARTRNRQGSIVEKTPESVVSKADDVPSGTGRHVFPSVDNST